MATHVICMNLRCVTDFPKSVYVDAFLRLHFYNITLYVICVVLYTYYVL